MGPEGEVLSLEPACPSNLPDLRNRVLERKEMFIPYINEQTWVAIAA